jgi:hypothetical protein
MDVDIIHLAPSSNRGKFGRISIKKEIIFIEVNLPGIE